LRETPCFFVYANPLLRIELQVSRKRRELPAGFGDLPCPHDRSPRAPCVDSLHPRQPILFLEIPRSESWSLLLHRSVYRDLFSWRPTKRLGVMATSPRLSSPRSYPWGALRGPLQLENDHTFFSPGMSWLDGSSESTSGFFFFFLPKRSSFNFSSALCTSASFGSGASLSRRRSKGALDPVRCAV